VILQLLERQLLPRRCAFCATRCEEHETHICEPCLDDLPWQTEIVLLATAPLAVSIAPFEYRFPIDAALKALKFKRRLDYVPAFADMLWRIHAELPQDIDALLPVPLHWRRHAVRGFNQAVELCRELKKRTGLPVLQNFRRCRATPFQSGLEAGERRRNLRDAFESRGRVKAQHVLIIDDVITTGATCSELARVARAAGAEKVSALAIART
jgi:ComF family protein